MSHPCGGPWRADNPAGADRLLRGRDLGEPFSRTGGAEPAELLGALAELERTLDERTPEGAWIRAVKDLIVRSVDRASETAGPTRPAALERMRRAFEARTPVAGKILVTVEEGAFVYLEAGLYGFAPRRELASWTPRSPRRTPVGHNLSGLVTAVAEREGVVFISPRCLALARARHCLGISRRVSGRLLWTGVDGIAVDLGGQQGFAPRSELKPRWLLERRKRGSPWRGYVTAIGNEVVALSHFGPRTRRERRERRRRALAAIAKALDQPVAEPLLRPGLVLESGRHGALVALEDGLITGLVPAPALDRWPQIAAGRQLRFRVISQPQHPDPGVDLLVEPHDPGHNRPLCRGAKEPDRKGDPRA